ncbi:MAG: sulfatase [Planctomycetes bacterium]|nr:sulfatase [Planctomycetota bacterium]
MSTRRATRGMSRGASRDTSRDTSRGASSDTSRGASGGAWHTGVATLLLACAAACGSGEPATGVLHLTPKLADGRSSAEVLATAERRRTFEVAPTTQGDSIAPWKLRFAELHSDAEGKGFGVFGNVKEAGGFKRVELVLGASPDVSIDARDVDAVELVVRKTQRGLARLTWRRDDEGPDVDTWTRHVDAHVEDSDGEQTIVLALADHPEWRGRIVELSLVPKQDGWQRFELVRLALVRGGFTPGPDRSDDGSDAGLVARMRETRRSFPSDLGRSLFSTARIPRGGRFVAEVALANGARACGEETTFAVDVRSLDEPAWHEAGKLVLPPTDAPEERWQPFSVDLADRAGEEVELRLRAFHGAWNESASSTIADAPLDRALVHWGAPAIVGELEARRRPNLILVTLDTTRADALGEGRTPYFDALAAQSLDFTNAWCTCNATSPSHASILTGLAVQDHGVTDNRSLLGAQNVTLAERLRAAGYTTGAAVSVEHLQAGKSGLGQGFDQFLLTASDASRDGSITIRAVKDWLATWETLGDRPFFLWVHLFDAHTPYGPPQNFLDEYCKRWSVTPPPKDVEPATMAPNHYTEADEFLHGVDNKAYAEFLYQAAVAYQDALIENLMAEVARLGLAEHTVLALTADHGESLGEHEHWYDHVGLYGEVMEVPLLLHVPGVAPARVAAAASGLDLAPTLLALGGAATDGVLRGTDLVELAKTGRERTLFFEHSDRVQLGARDAEHHVIVTLTDFAPWDGARKRAKDELELYEHRTDPALLDDRAAADPARATRWREALETWRKTALDRRGERGTRTPEEERRLRELGYAGE